MKKFAFISLFLIFSVTDFVFAKDYTQKIYLWEHIPRMETQKRDTILYYYPATESSESPSAAVIICPGGSYHHLGMPHEGFASARWFSSHGCAAFVLRYRVAYNCHHYPDQLEDMQDDIGHQWSKRSLLGHQWKEPNATKGWSPFNFWGHAYSQTLKDEFSMELNVPDDMPPTFILACEDDPVVIYENSVRLDAALSEKNIPHLFVSYPKGGHGFGMKENSFIMKETHWNDTNLLPWLIQLGIIEN